MVSVTDSHTGLSSKYAIDVEAWLASLASNYSPEALRVIRQACDMAKLTHITSPRLSGESYFQHALAVASILASVQMDYETLVAALLHEVIDDANIGLAGIKTSFGDSIAGLVVGVHQMEVGQTFKGADEHAKAQKKEREQAESLRKMLFAMVEDVRVVLIKLADRTHNLRTLAPLPIDEQKRIARETLDIYAPLANRLGMWQLKWELEDLSFRYLEPELYKRMAKMLDERRVDREKYIQEFLDLLYAEINKTGVVAEISGRPKHIYSIYRKMHRKGIDYHQVYDTRGVRVLVNSIADCYTVLGVVHSLWRYLPHEFDDYVATPKANNYQSIHTAIFGPDNKIVEVQIRTHQMHDDNEMGVAAHWRYKEGAAYDESFENKIAWLRQLLEWREDTADAGEFVEQFKTESFESRIYVFTPKGNVVDLPVNATPLDFAYYIHTEVGHRCRGAKVNGHIVPLTYALKTGEQVEVLTVKHGEPGRDWLNADLGYLKTSRARNKVQHWFNTQHNESNIVTGRALFEKELQRLNLAELNHEKVAKRLDYASADDLFVAIGRNEIKISKIVKSIQAQVKEDGGSPEPIIHTKKPVETKASAGDSVTVLGVGDLLTQFALCCKPVPGDDITGYITRGRGITIHRQDCANVLISRTESPERLVEVAWGDKAERVYPVDVLVTAFDRQGLLRDVSLILANERVNVIAVNTLSDKKEHIARMTLTLEVVDLDVLSKLLAKINCLPNVVDVKRKNR